MTVKREAAYHEAGHAILAHKSKYHDVVGSINLLKYGAGELYLSLSRSKCKAAGKPQDPSAQEDKDVARDLAVVLCGGLAAEKIASEMHSELSPNHLCAAPDHELTEQQLAGAGLSKNYDSYEEQAHHTLTENWKLVEKLADYLFEKQFADPDDIIAIIESP